VLENRRLAPQWENPSNFDAFEKPPKDFEIQVLLLLVLHIEVNVVKFGVKDVKGCHAILASGRQILSTI
jgi:hypothetical protein